MHTKHQVVKQVAVSANQGRTAVQKSYRNRRAREHHEEKGGGATRKGLQEEEPGPETAPYSTARNPEPLDAEQQQKISTPPRAGRSSKT